MIYIADPDTVVVSNLGPVTRSMNGGTELAPAVDMAKMAEPDRGKELRSPLACMLSLPQRQDEDAQMQKGYPVLTEAALHSRLQLARAPLPWPCLGL